MTWIRSWSERQNIELQKSQKHTGNSQGPYDISIEILSKLEKEQHKQIIELKWQSNHTN